MQQSRPQHFQISISERLRPTPFHHRVMAAGVKAFTVYNHTLLPAVFESIEADYWHLLEHVQVWDVSCEKQVELKGPDATRLAQYMTPRNLSSCVVGQCMYAPLVDQQGRIVNDPVILRLAEDHWWISVADSDVLLWAMGLATGRGFDVTISEPPVYPLAVQGPKSFALMRDACGDWVDDLRFFRFHDTNIHDIPVVIARSGWSKQGGFEIYLKDEDRAHDLWDLLFEAGAQHNVRAGCPNFIERIEGGLLSYGNEMTLEHNPFECGLDGFCDLEQENEILSRDALIAIRDDGPKRRLVGIEIDGEPIAPQSTWIDTRHHDIKVGHIASAVYSPRLKKNLGLAMIESSRIGDADLCSTIDGADRKLTQVALPFD